MSLFYISLPAVPVRFRQCSSEYLSLCSSSRAIMSFSLIKSTWSNAQVQNLILEQDSPCPSSSSIRPTCDSGSSVSALSIWTLGSDPCFLGALPTNLRLRCQGVSESRGSRPNGCKLQRVKRKGNRMTAVSYRFPCQGMDKGALRLIE